MQSIESHRILAPTRDLIQRYLIISISTLATDNIYVEFSSGSHHPPSGDTIHGTNPSLVICVLTFTCLIHFCREKTTRQLYYLQLRSNLLNYSQAVSEEKCFLLAAYALLTDYGKYDQDQHQGDYFDPREYFPAWVSSGLQDALYKNK